VGSGKLDLLLLFDGIAIFLIVLDHGLIYYPENPLYFLYPSIGYLGLSLFTFTSGYKLFFNHEKDLGKKIFLGQYFTKRFIRMYKPYIGYTLLIFLPLLFIDYIAINIFHFNFPGSVQFITSLETMTFAGFLSFLLGNNFVSGHLWYLIALIGITSICFTILYFSNIKWLFSFFVPFFLISFWIWATMKLLTEPNSIGLVPMIIVLLPFFIFGAFWAYNQHNKQSEWFVYAEHYCPVLFLILAFSSVLVQNPGYKTILTCFYCMTFPFFISAIAEYIKKIRFVYPFLMFSGKYSFPIFLFHIPLILRPLERGTIDLMRIDFFFMPIVLSILSMYISVGIYLILKKIYLDYLIE
jgi:peptidoglycan/LPS O-acetylase OafA/YrhL